MGVGSFADIEERLTAWTKVGLGRMQQKNRSGMPHQLGLGGRNAPIQSGVLGFFSGTFWGPIPF